MQILSTEFKRSDNEGDLSTEFKRSDNEGDIID
jgi:hypothetical protein